MLNLKFFIKAIFLVLLSGILGFTFWYFRNTSEIVDIALSSTPLAIDNGRTNLLIMGVGGEGHEGSDLTDTILLVSLGEQNKDVKVLSIPRDIWLDSLKARINSAYHYGNEQGATKGLAFAKKEIGNFLGINIHYVAVIDFNGFIKLIDIVGGVDVVVDQTFDDYKYPIPGQETAEPESDRYEHLHFDKGLNQMDGVTALKFARSRHAEGPEGTDFARGARQQKIITALKDKVISSKTLLNLATINKILVSLKSSIDTDVGEDLYASFFKWSTSFAGSGQNVRSGDLTPYLTNPKNSKPYGGAWVLIAKEDLKSYVAQFLAE